MRAKRHIDFVAGFVSETRKKYVLKAFAKKNGKNITRKTFPRGIYHLRVALYLVYFA